MSQATVSLSKQGFLVRLAARRGVYPGWVMVGASFVGLAMGQSAIAFLTLGVFIKPLGDDFGWGRGDVTLALSMGAIILAFATPFAGRLIDRYGARRILLPSMFLYGLILASLYFLTPSLAHFYGVFLAIGIIGTGANNVSYIRILSAWFIERRGLALGIASAGVAGGHAGGAYLAQVLIDLYDWRMAYLGLGAMIVLVGLPIVATVIRNAPEDVGLKALGAAEEETPKDSAANLGFSRSQALRMPVFWGMVASAFLMSSAFHGFQIHFIPLQTDMGIDPLMAAGPVTLVASLAGLCGRIGAGYLFDRFFAPHVTIVIFLLPVLGFGIFLGSPTLAGAFIIAVATGVGAGAESDVLGYMTSRYFGMKAIAELYSYVFAGFMLGTALGPTLYGYAYDVFGTYDSSMVLSMVFLLIICGLMTVFPRFPVFKPEETPGDRSD